RHGPHVQGDRVCAPLARAAAGVLRRCGSAIIERTAAPPPRADRPGTGSPRSYLPRAWANDRAPPRTSSCSPSNRRQRRSARKFCGAAAACHMCDVRSGRGASGAAAPEPAIAACDELQAVLIAGPACVFLKLERLLALVPTFAGEPH